LSEPGPLLNDPGPLFGEPGPLFNEPGPRLSIRTGGSLALSVISPTAGEVSSDNPAIAPNMISFQLVLFIIVLPFLEATPSICFYPADCCEST
jgi:hypothetical protein